jgi:hypothetical protein
MIFIRVDVWWEGTVGPCHEYERWAAFQSEHDHDENGWPPEDVGIEDPDECAWDITAYRVKFEDLPEEIKAWVSTNPCPNGVIPDESHPERRPVPLWVKAAFLEAVKHQHTNLMVSSDTTESWEPERCPFCEVDTLKAALDAERAASGVAMEYAEIERDEARRERDRLAASIPGWRWMPGMRDGDDGSRCVRIERRAVTWLYDAIFWDGVDEGVVESDQPSNAWPDPDDPATAGCLLALLGTTVLHMAWTDAGFLVCVQMDGPNGIDAAEFVAENMGRACIAAAAALGRWPGGDNPTVED